MLACFDAVTAGMVAKKAAYLGFDLPQARLSNPNPEREPRHREPGGYG